MIFEKPLEIARVGICTLLTPLTWIWEKKTEI